MNPPARLLVRSVNWLGDAVMSTPALSAIRAAWPQTRITMLTPAKLADLWRAHPALDEVKAFHPADNAFAVARALRPDEHDAALILPNSFRSALEPFLAGIPRRIGHAGQLRSMLLTQPIQRNPAEQKMRKRTKAEIIELNARGVWNQPYTLAGHQIHHYLDLVRALGIPAPESAPVLGVHDQEIAAFREKFTIHAPTVIGINAGAEYGPAKRWPRERFVETIRHVANQQPAAWVIFGAKADIETAEWIAGELRNSLATENEVHVVAGKTSLRELCAGLKLCRVLLTNDTGPMHVAAAVGTTVIVPFGSTSPELTGPDPLGLQRHQIIRTGVPCSPCFLRECPIDFRCMTTIASADVAASVLAALNAKGAK
ncbi:MAG TPA: lipopolysaccharide heptosyltransferase II [Methylomirabilota bacterium]|nr:lipopolysaccharide heptosyltransferase II [Methylomirabilota bacterium]